MNIKVFDTTLRDGEQQACINFSKEQKIEMALLFKKMGVDYVGMMPCQSSAAEEVTRIMLENGVCVLPLTPLNKGFVYQSLELSSKMTLFQAGSDDLLKIRYKTDDVNYARRVNTEKFVEYLQLVREVAPETEIFVGLEDVTSADRGYLLEFMNAIKGYFNTFIIADSKGTATPEEISDLTKFFKDNTDVELGIHTHNDLGNANVNAIAAIKAGATILNGTITGIGERAGNCDTRKVLEELKKDGIVAENIDYDMFDEVEGVVRKYAKRGPSEPRSAEAFWHETGIHVNALLSDPSKGYNAIDPKVLGFEHQVFFGKKSGISNFKYFLKDSVSDEVLRSFLETIKESSSEENRSYTFNEALDIIKVKHKDVCESLKL